MAGKMVEIDGGYLEGGGQILRTAVAVSAVTGIPCRITDIRKGRQKPGLRAQHLKSIEAVSRICRARLAGAAIGSQEIEFHPGKLDPPEGLSMDVGTAGSVSLVLQALLIPLGHCRKRVRVTVSGGTHVEWSPVMDYFQHVFAYFLERMRLSVLVEHLQHGFYPRGGGRVIVTAEGGELCRIALTERGEFIKNAAWSVATQDLRKARVAERQIKAARDLIDVHAEHTAYVGSRSTGSCIYLHSCYENCRLGASALGKRGKPAESVGRECARALRKQIDSRACLDQHMADQILPYMALAEKDSHVTVAAITDHCRTNAWVLEKFLPVRFSFSTEEQMISCTKSTGSGAFGS